MAKPPKHAEVAAVAAAPVEVSTPKTVHNKKLEVLGEIKPEAKLTWHIHTNPRAQGRATFDRFAAYFKTPTVAAYNAAGGTRGDLLWDLRSGYLSIEGVELGGEISIRKTPEPKAKAEPKEPKAPREKKVKASAAPLEAETDIVEEMAD